MTTRQMTDAELAGQPAAYWTGVAYEALIAYTRARQAEKGYTQPQFWLLRNLSANDISPDGEGMTLPELREAMRSYIRPEDDLAAESAVL
ncbi:MarR family transcriptional regulator, partial [Kitasatospora sp. NPDC047058]